MSIRLTKNQQQIWTLLQQLGKEMSAQQLHLELRQNGSKIGLATVYRTLKSLHLEGIIQERVTLLGESFYYPITEADHPHHHHLNCVHCGQSIPLKDKDCPIGRSLIQWCQSQNFKVYYHTLEFFGLCDTCQAQQEGIKI